MRGHPPETEPEIRIDPGAVAEVCFCLHLRRAARGVSRVYDQALQPSGIKASQFNVLVAISSTDPATVPKVAKALAMDRTTLLRNLRPLAAAGFLQVAAGSGRRPDEISLTVSGRNTLTLAIRAWQTAQRQITQQLGGSHAAQLLQGLGRLMA
ncbi:MAG: MarR family winged helix-turn-helix transcriptional regulator [Rhodospirillaceae bacterium]